MTPPPQQEYDDRRQYDVRGGDQGGFGSRKQVCLPHFNEVYHVVERGWAGQTWTWCSKRVSLTLSPTPYKWQVPQIPQTTLKDDKFLWMENRFVLSTLLIAYQKTSGINKSIIILRAKKFIRFGISDFEI